MTRRAAPLDNREIVIIDVETTGLYPQYGDRVVEVAALKMRGQQVIERFECLINPQRPVSYGAFQVNGITNEMLAGAPLFQDILPELEAFLADTCLVGHNIRFDLRFLSNEFLLAGRPGFVSELAIDTVKMARALIPHLNRFSLSNVSAFLGVKEKQAHRAMSDVLMTHQVFLKLLALAEDNDIARFDILMNLFGTKKLSKQRKFDKIQIIEAALDLQAKLKMLYFGVSSGPTVRDVTPQRIIGSGKEATLVGFCHLRQEERNFKIDRIIHLKQ